MKNIYILILISTLVACSDRSQDKTQSSLSNEQNVDHTEVYEHQPIATSEVLAAREAEEKIDMIAIAEESDQVTQVFCSDQDITEWYGFDEATTEPKCETVKKFKLISYKCDISPNAFGADKDAILLENKDQRIFVYSNSKDCREMLEIRNSNAP
ncbi:hypothetical protein GPS57_16330 [Acinetobacter haemolyticus]|uniref:hypothetical protein n=1 Tax=Acinetobacter haemolyticus TaxID=29430 RepID=UPI00137252D6|nr:hypothetical protein [Acinetobacter haemolyticus]NAR65296.1 hypothetical protein [Acinetobacter haemolyticus]